MKCFAQYFWDWLLVVGYVNAVRNQRLVEVFLLLAHRIASLTALVFKLDDPRRVLLPELPHHLGF